MRLSRNQWIFHSVTAPGMGAVFCLEVYIMETRVAVMSIIVENGEAVEKINALLHENGDYIIGRMGIPYRAKQLSLISIALDAPEEVIHALKHRLVEHDGVRAEIVEA